MFKVEFFEKSTIVYIWKDMEIVECKVGEVTVNYTSNNTVKIEYRLDSDVLHSSIWKHSKDVFDSKEKLKQKLLKQFV